MATSPTLPTNLKNAAVTIVNADASALKTILTADGTFWDVTSLNVTSDDTSGRILSFYITISATDYLIGSVSVPAASGTDGTTASVNVFSSSMMQLMTYDAFANRILHLDTGIVLKCKSTTTVTAAKTVTITATAIKTA